MKRELTIRTPQGMAFGGSQNWWKNKNKRLWKYGCGVICMCDLQMLLEKRGTSPNNNGRTSHHIRLDQDEYMEYVEKYYGRLYPIFLNPIPYLRGLTPIQMMLGFARWKKGKDTPVRGIFWTGFPLVHFGNILSRYIEEGLKKDLPIIVSVHSAGGIRFYNRPTETASSRKVNNHYFLITDHRVAGGESWYQVCSWGRMFYIKKGEYLKKAGLFTNVFAYRF